MTAKKKAVKKPPKPASIKKTISVPGPKPDPYPNAVPRKKFDVQRRLSALAAYLADLTGGTIEDLHKGDFKDIPLPTLRRWAHEDGWVQHRKEAFASLQKRLSAETSKFLTDQVYREVRELQRWSAKAAQLLEDTTLTPPRSWEGVFKIHMEAMRREAELAKGVTAGVIDEMGRPAQQQQSVQNQMGPRTDFSPQDLLELAKIYTTQSREKTREKLRITNPEMFEDDIPLPAEDAEGTYEELPAEAHGAGDDCLPEITGKK